MPTRASDVDEEVASVATKEVASEDLRVLQCNGHKASLCNKEAKDEWRALWHKKHHTALVLFQAVQKNPGRSLQG